MNQETRNDCQNFVVINVETNIFRWLNSYPSKKFNLSPLTIAISPTKETNIQMILVEEDIQQLRIRKTKGTGEQSFNLFSTSIAAFKVFHGRISNPNPFLMQHVAFILLCKISPSWITIYKLFLFYSNTWRDPQLQRREWLVGNGERGGG